MFKIIKSDLVRELSFLAKLVTKKNNIEILTYCKFTAAGEQVVMEATDLDNTIRIVVPTAGVMTPGTLLLPIKSTLDMARSFPEGEIEITRKDYDVTLQIGTFKTLLKGLPKPEIYPTIDSVTEFPFWMKASEFLQAHSSLQDLTTEEKSGYVLNCFEFGREDEALTITATDGHRLGRFTTERHNLPEDFNAYLSKATLNILATLAKDKQTLNDYLEIGLGSGSDMPIIGFRARNRSLIARKVKGKFPGISSFTNAVFSNRIRFNVQQLTDSIKRITAACAPFKDKKPGTLFFYHDSVAELIVVIGDTEIRDQIPCVWLSPPIENFVAGQNIYHLGGFARLAKDDVTLAFNDNGGVFEITCDDDESTRFFLMPMVTFYDDYMKVFSEEEFQNEVTSSLSIEQIGEACRHPFGHVTKLGFRVRRDQLLPIVVKLYPNLSRTTTSDIINAKREEEDFDIVEFVLDAFGGEEAARSRLKECESMTAVERASKCLALTKENFYLTPDLLQFIIDLVTARRKAEAEEKTKEAEVAPVEPEAPKVEAKPKRTKKKAAASIPEPVKEETKETKDAISETTLQELIDNLGDEEAAIKEVMIGFADETGEINEEALANATEFYDSEVNQKDRTAFQSASGFAVTGYMLEEVIKKVKVSLKEGSPTNA